MANEDRVLYLDVDSVYGADELGLPYRDLVSEGVVGSGDFDVTQRAAGANMSVDVAAGACWVKGDDDANLQPTYRYREPATTNVAVTAADPTNPRVDRVVAEVLDSTFSGVSKLGRLRIIDGTPTGGADLSNLSGAAAVPNNALLLANVLVGAGATSVTDANIGDVRALAALGGVLGRINTTGDAVIGGTVQTGDDVLVRPGQASLTRLGAVAPNATDAGVKLGSAGDVVLYRSTNPVVALKTDNRFESGEDMYAQIGAAAQVRAGEINTDTPGLTFGSAQDTNLYRSAANTLKTDDAVHSVGGFSYRPAAATGDALSTLVGAESFGRFNISHSGVMSWGSGGEGQDTNLYRSAAATLKTDGGITATALSARAGAGLAIASGAITVTHGFHRLTSTDASTLATINGGQDGMYLTLINKTGGIVSFSAAGNLKGSTSDVQNNGIKTFVYDAAESKWHTAVTSS